jgi:hypothetical protein
MKMEKKNLIGLYSNNVKRRTSVEGVMMIDGKQVGRREVRGYYWYSSKSELFLGSLISTFWHKPEPCQKWEPYFLILKRNILIAKKPRIPRIQKTANKYFDRLRVEDKLLYGNKIKYSDCSIHEMKKSFMFTNKKCLGIFKDLVKMEVENLTCPLIVREKSFSCARKHPVLNVKGRFKGETFPNIVFVIKKNHFSNKVSHIWKSKFGGGSFKQVCEKDVRRLRLRKVRLFNEPLKYKEFKYKLWLFNDKQIFDLSSPDVDYMLTMINSRYLLWRPKVFPGIRENWLRYPYRFWCRRYVKWHNIILILSQNKGFYPTLLETLKKNPGRIGYPNLEHWYSQKVLSSIFNLVPETYFSHIKHWIKNKSIGGLLNKADQISNGCNMPKSRFRQTYFHSLPILRKFNKKVQFTFNSKYPYTFREISFPDRKRFRYHQIKVNNPGWWYRKSREVDTKIIVERYLEAERTPVPLKDRGRVKGYSWIK